MVSKPMAGACKQQNATLTCKTKCDQEEIKRWNDCKERRKGVGEGETPTDEWSGLRWCMSYVR